MIAQEAEISTPLESPRCRMVKLAWGWFLVFLVWLAPMVGCAEEKPLVAKNPPSNEDFLRGSIRSLVEHTLVDFPGDQSGLIILKSEEAHPAGWLLENELISYLVSLDYQVALQPAAYESSLKESQSLFYRIIDLSLSYPQIEREGFLGGRLLTRRTSLNLSFRLEDGVTGRVLWSEKGKEERSDLIKRSMAKSVNNQTYPFLSPALPDDPQSRYLEPAMVIAVVGGLIYLFFANR